MTTGEVKIYKGKKIKAVGKGQFVIPGFIGRFNSYYEAKGAIDACVAEDRALEEIDAYVRNVIGGYI